MNPESEKAVDLFNRLASEYRDKFIDVSLYVEALQAFCEKLPGTAPEVLEIGCGPGNVIHFLLSRRPEILAVGIDLAPNMLALAREANPSSTFELRDARDILEMERSFDGILCTFVTPYLAPAETSKLIRDCSQMLKSGGILYLSTMEGQPSQSGLHKGSSGDEIFIHYHPAEALLATIESNGLHPFHEQRISNVMGAGIQVVDWIVLARKS